MDQDAGGAQTKEVIVMQARKATFAGSWYPGRPSACEKEITDFLEGTEKKPAGGKAWVGGIVPHAGWYFSGKIACNVIHNLVSEIPPDVIVVFGMHLHPGSPAYIMTEGTWETPFGNLPIASELAQNLTQAFDFEIETTTRYHQDNTIELQLPFIKYFFSDVAIVPIGVPPTRKSLEIGQAVAHLSAELGLRINVIGSTDLTHYGTNYGFAPRGAGSRAVEWVRDKNDRRVIEAMLAMQPEQVIAEALENSNACCAGAAATALAAGKALGSEKAELLAYATSYDKSPGDSFVGYVGILF
jgi:AmmeMemoRadiSam system protein B